MNAHDDMEMAALFLATEISDESLEAAAGSLRMSGSSNPGVNCTGGCKKGEPALQ